MYSGFEKSPKNNSFIFIELKKVKFLFYASQKESLRTMGKWSEYPF